MIIPELPPDIADLKERVARFVEQEVYPLEDRIAERGSIEPAEIDELRRNARAAGFAMLNMPPEHGGIGLSMLGQVAIEEESGKATNGLGFAVVDRGPRELLEIATADQAERFVAPIVRGEYREAWALTEPGAGSDLSGLTASAVRDGEGWILNGEKWFVTSEGDPGVYVVLRSPRRAGALPRGARARARDPAGRRSSSMTPTSTTIPRSFSATAVCRSESRSGERRRRCEGVDPRRAALHRRPLLRRRDAACSTSPPNGLRSERRSARRSPSTRASRSRSPTR